MQGLTWLLVPVAAFGGWLAASRLPGRRQAARVHALSPDYLKGLDYLLNEEPDKAIDVFTRMLELTADTPDTHSILADQYLKLGSAFRRRGEVGRAIRIHQELVSRVSLGNEQRTEALLALAQDYLSAGILGRAEELLLQLAQQNVHTQQVLPWLLDIYQQEKDWENSIRIAEQMETLDGRPAGHVIAHYYCEMAMTASERGASDQARVLLHKALSRDSDCARASILLGDLERDAGRHAEALSAYCRVAGQDIERVPLVLDSIRFCHETLGSSDRLHDFLAEIIPRYRGIAPVVVQAELLAAEQGPREATTFLAGHLARWPSVTGLGRLVKFTSSVATGWEAEFLELVDTLVAELQQDRPAYSCHACGFSGKTLHWFCPGCRQWDTVRPIHGVEGD